MAYEPSSTPISSRRIKRAIDVILATVGLLIASPIVLVAFVVATAETRQWGIFRQRRVGLHGRTFDVLKIRTMRPLTGISTTATTARDPRITRWGRFFRRMKIDELPQLWNVVCGDMSLVGPRPDVPELMQTLPDDIRSVLLSVRPGVTGPATLRFRNEEVLLALQDDPERYNREVLFPQKARLNCDYIQNYRLQHDFVCLAQTVFPVRIQSASPFELDSPMERAA